MKRTEPISSGATATLLHLQFHVQVRYHSLPGREMRCQISIDFLVYFLFSQAHKMSAHCMPIANK